METATAVCTHTWTQLLASRHQFRCSQCGILGYNKITSGGGSMRHRDLAPKHKTIHPYLCANTNCLQPAVVRGTRQSWCEQHRANASR